MSTSLRLVLLWGVPISELISGGWENIEKTVTRYNNLTGKPYKTAISFAQIKLKNGKTVTHEGLTICRDITLEKYFSDEVGLGKYAHCVGVEVDASGYGCIGDPIGIDVPVWFARGSEVDTFERMTKKAGFKSLKPRLMVVADISS